jgi:hypothetical protein
MKKVNTIAAVLVAACAASIAANPADAAPKKQKRQLSSTDATRLACLKQIGATRQGGYWYTQGGIGTAQQQAFYNCLDSYTMNRR